MTPERFEAISSQGGVVNLSARAKWQLTGPDRVRYLNGQVTNNVKRAAARAALYACVTNVKGRIEGDLYYHSALLGEGEVLLADAEPGLRDSLGARLERYIIADDVELTDVTTDWELWHAFGPAAERLRTVDLSGIAHVVEANRWGSLGVDLWRPLDANAPPPAEMAPLLTESELETWRILSGVPRWPAELNADTFPPEAGLQDRAMDYAKGCYIGQEILSRIKTTGKMPQTLVAVKTAPDASVALKTGGLLFDRGTTGAPVKVGHITSATVHPVTGAGVGLAYVKQAAAGADSLLLALEEAPTITCEVDLSHP